MERGQKKMNNPISDVSTRMGRKSLRGASVQQAESSMRIFYRNVSFERIRSKYFTFRIVRNKQ